MHFVQFYFVMCSCALREAFKVKLLCSSTSSIPSIPKFFSMFLPFISPLFAFPCLAVVFELNRQLLLSYCLFIRIEIAVDSLVSFCQPVMQRAMVGNVFLAPTVQNEARTYYYMHVLHAQMLL